MSVTVIVELPSQPEKTEELKALVHSLLPETRAFDGFEDITFNQDQDDPTRLVFCETWASRSAYEKYLAWRTETGTLDALGAYLAGEPSFRFFDIVE